MDNREKIVYGLECCADQSTDCKMCPYDDPSDFYGEYSCKKGMAKDILRLLKTRVLSKEEVLEIAGKADDFYDRQVCYIEWKNMTQTRPVLLFLPKEDDDLVEYMWICDDQADFVAKDKYLENWRLWNYDPTDEQRKAATWNEVRMQTM